MVCAGSFRKIQLPSKFRRLLHLHEKTADKCITVPYSHLISVGDSELLFEMWIDPDFVRLISRYTLLADVNCLFWLRQRVVDCSVSTGPMVVEWSVIGMVTSVYWRRRLALVY